MFYLGPFVKFCPRNRKESPKDCSGHL